MAFFQTPGGAVEANRFNPQINPQLQGLLSQTLGQLKTNSQGGFAPIEQQARRQFQTQTIPGLAERFTSLGDSAQRSSAFQGALGNAASGLESNLAALKGQHGMQQNQQLMQLLSMLLPTQEQVYKPEEPGFLGSFAPALGSIAGSALTGFGLGGPIGAGLGAGTSLLSSLLSLLSGNKNAQQPPNLPAAPSWTKQSQMPLPDLFHLGVY